MRRRHRESMPFVWVLVLLTSLGAAGGAITGIFANSMRTADTLPPEDFEPVDFMPSAPVRADIEVRQELAAADTSLEDSLEALDKSTLFSPALSYTGRSTTYTVASLSTMPAPEMTTGTIPTAVEPGSAPQAEAKADIKPETKPAAPAPVRHANSGRPGGVLNDAQIANIKKRLKLTPDQEALWPAVEVALRNVSYSKRAQEMKVASVHSAPMAYVDPNSAEVQRLKYAALPLIMRLNEDQKQEVRSMVHVMGLESVASSF